MPKERAEGESVTGREAKVGAALRIPRRSPENFPGVFWNQSVRDTLGRRGKDNQTPERRGRRRAAWGQWQVKERTPVKKAKA